MGEEYRIPKRWIALAIASVILTLTLGYAFITTTADGLSKEKSTYLKEISVKGTRLVTQQIYNYFSTLEVISTVIGSSDHFSVDSALAILQPEASKGFFKRMGIIMPDGTAYTTDGYIADFSDRAYFHKAMSGQNAISDSLVDKIDGQEINVFASPIFQNDLIVGVIFVTKSQQDLSRSLIMQSFGGEGYSHIISGDGRPIVKTNHPNSIGDYSNFFDVMLENGVPEEELYTIRSRISARGTGMLEYTREGELYQMFYMPAGINDWYIFSVVPSQIISQQSDHLIHNLGFLMALIVVLTILIGSGLMGSFQRNNKRLSHIAYTDPITGHSNWAKFLIDAKRLLRENSEQPYAVLAFDINKFKLINDLFGYQRGNEILIFVGSLLARNMQEGETFCRAAADHFTLLLQYKSDGDTLHRLTLIEDELERYIENYKIQISTGICPVIEADLDVSVHSDRANISRNIAKKQNSANYHFFKDENRMELLREKEIENVMDAAIEHGEFLVYLQPKYRSDNDHIAGAEALVRWNRPGEGLVPPGDFIPLFEKNGFIRKLDIYMFESVCRLMASWQHQFPKVPPFSISVNISRVHLSNPELSADLRQIADQYGVPLEYLEIELTESAIFENVEEMRTFMTQLKKAGFQLSIDDFGSGYSSLASLKSLPADIVKMDKSFLDEAENDQRGEKIICGMVDMIKSLGMITVAEGVETLTQLEFLKMAGCDIVQGYYWAKPMPAEEFEALVFKK